MRRCHRVFRIIQCSDVLIFVYDNEWQPAHRVPLAQLLLGRVFLLDITELLFSELSSEEMVVPVTEDIFSPAGVLSTIGLQPIKVIIVPEMNKDVRVLVTPMRIVILLK